MKSKTIIWAMDPQQNPADAASLIKEMRMWAKKLKSEIQPVSVFSEANVYLPAEITFSWQADLKKSLQRSMEKYMKQTKTTDFLTPKMILSPRLSNRAFATDLAKAAEKAQAVMIFVNTRAKNTWNPFRLGGFAETLMATSRVPVLLMNSKTKATSNIDSILFPTDFSQEAKNSLLKLLPWAQAFKAKIHLFNHVENPVDSLNYLSEQMSYKDLISDLQSERLQKMESTASLIAEHSLDCETTVTVQKKYLAQEIVELARKSKADLIAIPSRSGKFAQALIGGIPRDVVLEADKPVLVFYKTKAVKNKKARKIETKIHIQRESFPTPNILV